MRHKVGFGASGDSSADVIKGRCSRPGLQSNRFLSPFGTTEPSNERVLWWHLYLHRLARGPCPRTPCSVVRQPRVFQDGVTKAGDLASRSKSKPTSRVKAIGWSCHQARMDLCPGCLFAGFRAECLRNRVFEIKEECCGSAL